jgi:hypothetical protein
VWRQTEVRSASSGATDRRNCNNDEFTGADQYGYSAHGFVPCY